MEALVVYGTRPELIKLFPIIRELRSRGHSITAYSTKQHSLLLAKTERSLRFSPDIAPGVISSHRSLNELWSRVLYNVIAPMRSKPKYVIVQGDTATAVATAIAAFNSGIDVVHVEAGVRTYNSDEPYPEEIYRQLISRIADIHMCPTDDAKENLLNENLCTNDRKIYVTGNTELDSVDYALGLNESGWINDITCDVIVTIHRRESIGEPIRDICSGIRRLSESRDIILPVHVNPEVSKIINSELCGIESVHLVSPVEFVDFIHLLAKSNLVITDSGGVQEDCSYLGIPVVIARNITDRPEAVEAGGAVIAGTSGDSILGASKNILNNSVIYDIMAKSTCPFGDGNASRRIVDALEVVYG